MAEYVSVYETLGSKLDEKDAEIARLISRALEAEAKLSIAPSAVQGEELPDRPKKESVKQFATMLTGISFVQWAEFVRYADKVEAETSRLKGERDAYEKTVLEAVFALGISPDGPDNAWHNARAEAAELALSASRADALEAVRSLYSDELSVEEAAIVAQAELKLLALDGGK